MTDEEMLQLWRQQATDKMTAGIWLEVTPQLAQDAGVQYRGRVETWYQAGQVLLVGYDKHEREKIIETIYQQYNEVFAGAPVIAGAWGIDSESLQIMQQQGLQIWMDVREQVGTDSYNHDGGPTHYPYFASKNWYLVPSEKNDGLLIIKHTITDPLLNYGDDSSSYTAQPNDYERAGLTTETYWKDLLKQAMNQGEGQRGWAVMGLENSMASSYQQEYQKQLEFVADYERNSDQLQVIDWQAMLARFREEPKIRLYQGKNLTSDEAKEKVWWIETPRYRLRLRQSAELMVLDDVRVYDENFEDYYNQRQAENGLWQIVPPVMDGSVVRAGQPGVPALKVYGRSGDVPLKRGWQLPTPESEVQTSRKADGSLSLSYQSVGGKMVELIFGKETWTSSVELAPWGDFEGNWPWQQVDYPSQQVITEQNHHYQMSYSSTPEKLALAREKYQAVLLPEIASAPANKETSKLIVNSHYALAGKTPVRILWFALNENGFPVRASNSELSTTAGVEVHEFAGNDPYIFYDLTSNKALSVKVKMKLDGQDWQEAKVYFINDCQADKESCGYNPVAWWHFLHFKLEQKKLAAESQD